ncbi:MAG: 4-(cytidine 5'-diphospho)-2-C-methyl-D-erythritol kinase [Clostridiaceae bacterium]|nr:4-(cytidine 5'-diphospho)-2-C-methyl-D-erythritol kinase [Clostridiaceae bacterium]
MTGRRANGYHNLSMIMQTIDLYDTLTIEKTGVPDISLTMNHDLPDKIPAEKNLVYKAASLMQKKYSLPYGFHIFLEKNIPAAAGLAGGSTDCAATLIAINKLCSLHLTTENLCEIGVTLGADVPFCIVMGTALAEGIGEILTPLAALEPIWTLLIKPDVSVSTAEVYQKIDERLTYIHPDTKLVMDAIANHDYSRMAGHLENVLETVTIPMHPVIGQLKEFFLRNGAAGSLMSGSGPTTYGLFQDKTLAYLAQRTAQEKYPDFDVILCRTCIPEDLETLC